MTHKTILTALIVFLLISFFYLSATQKQQSDAAAFWVVYFENPKSPDMNFTIENKSVDTTFHYAIYSGKNNPYHEEDVLVKKGEQKTIRPILDIRESKRINIRVTAGDNKKEIYKDI